MLCKTAVPHPLSFVRPRVSFAHIGVRAKGLAATPHCVLVVGWLVGQDASLLLVDLVIADVLESYDLVASVLALTTLS